MDITSEAPAAKDGARFSYRTALPFTEMSLPTVDDHLRELSDVREGPLRDESYTLGMGPSPEITAFDVALANETRTAGSSLSTESSATSVDTVTLTSCQPDPSAFAVLSRDGTPTPPPTGASAANRHGKFKKSLEDRYRIGQGAGGDLSRSGSTSSLTATNATVDHGRQNTLKLLQVEDVLQPVAPRDVEPRKSHSMDESGRKSRSVDVEWPAPRASFTASHGARSSSFDPCSSFAAATDDSPLDLSSRSAIVSGGWPSTSSATPPVQPPARRDAYRRAREEFEARARQRHHRKRSESEENIHVSYNGAATAAPLAFQLACGRLYHSDLRIDQSGRNGTVDDAGHGRDVGALSTMEIAVARDPSPFDQPPMSSVAHISSRRYQQRTHQYRQKSCSPTPCLSRRLLQPTLSPKGYNSSLEDGSPNRLPSDDESRLPVVRIASDLTAARPSPSSDVQRNGASTPSAAAPGWRVTPPVHLSAGPDSMDDGSGCGSPSGHSPGGSTLSAEDVSAAALSTGGSGSLDDATTAGGAGSPGTAGGARLHFCHVCERSFSRSDMLTRHVRLHTGLKPYECQLCGQQFSRSDHLSTHQRTHTGERPYRCPHCPYAACRRDMITRHLRVHGRSSSGGGSSEDDAGGLLAASAAAVAAAAPVPGEVAVATSAAADVRIKRRRLLQRGPWSGSGGSSGGGSSTATDLSSSWDSSLSYSFGSSSIESASGCANAADVSTAAAFGLSSAGSGGGGGSRTCGWLQALPQSRADAAGRSWRWSSNGSSSSSSGLGASLGCSSPDAASGGSGGCPRTFGNSMAVTSTASACGTTALPPFADVSWADATCGERTGQSAVGDVLPPSGGRTQAMVAMATVAAAVERATSCSGRSTATTVPLWSTVPFGFGRPGIPAVAGSGSLPTPAMAAALLYAAPSPTLALFGSIGTGMPGGPCERVQVALQSAAPLILGRSRIFDAGAAASAVEPVPACDTSIAASAKERKSLVRQDASMEQEDEPPLPLVSPAPASAADIVKMVALPITPSCSGQPPFTTAASQQQQLTQKSHRAATWLPHSSSNDNLAGGAFASTAAFVPSATSAVVHASGSPTAAVSLAAAPLLSSAAAAAATAVGGVRQASLSDELGKVSMTE